MRSHVHSWWLMPVAVCLLLQGCATRPDANVLQPVSGAMPAERLVTVLAATNRAPQGLGYSATWAGQTVYERYEISAPATRDGATINYPSKHPDPAKQYLVRKRTELTSEQVSKSATKIAGFDGTVGVFVHGYNYSYQEALFRAAQIAVDANLPVTPVLFSWPSAASVTGYVADRDSVLFSRRELGLLISALLKTPKIKRVVLFGHSMGGFLVMEAVRELKLQGRQDVLDRLDVVLAAPDIDVDVFRSQLQEIGRLKTPITLLVSNTDRALQVSSLIAQERPRVGRLNIKDDRLQDIAQEENLRVIDITSVEGTDGLGHDRYASVARFGSQLANFDNRSNPRGNVGAFVFDTAGGVVAAPFRLASTLAGGGR